MYFYSHYYQLGESVEKSFCTEGVGHLQIHRYRLAMEDCPNQRNYTASEMDTGARESSNLVYGSCPRIRFAQLPLRSLPIRLSFTVCGEMIRERSEPFNSDAQSPPLLRY